MENITAVTVVEKKIGAHTLRLETGKVAKQAHGALTVQYGDTIVLATVLSAPPTRDIDYFPLYVDYREMQYAGGKFPGGFFKREGRPSSKEVLSCRMVDRTIRPLFPDDYSNEVQVQCIVVSSDKECDPDVLAVIGGSAALRESGAVRGPDRRSPCRQGQRRVRSLPQLRAAPRGRARPCRLRARQGH